MIVEYIMAASVALISVVNLIIRRSKGNLIKLIIGIVFASTIFAFIYVPILKDYLYAYDALCLLYIVFIAIFMVPKRITKNLTEYDYFELDNAYEDMKNEHEKLRERFLSTISLIDEGIVFYENNFSDVFLSDRAQELFGGDSSTSLKDHALAVDAGDRAEYLRTIEHLTKRSNQYSLKYRVIRGGQRFWVEEKGNFIDVGSKKSIIATVRPLDPAVFKETSYFDIDSLYGEDKMYPALKDLISTHKPFVFVLFELSNIPEINEKYGRAVGNLMMNDYIKYMKATYQKEISKVFRISGLKFAMIIDDESYYADFHKSLISNGSLIYNIKIQIAGIKDVVKPNFGVIKYSSSRQIDSRELIKLADRCLDEARESNRRNYSIFGE